MINFDDYANENKSEHNSKWPYIPDNSYRILIIGGSGSGKTNALLNLLNNQPDIDKIYLYANDPYEAKYQHLINKHEKVRLGHFKAFIVYSNDMQDVYRTLNISTVFITQSYFRVPKDARLNSTLFFIMKIPNKRELQQIALYHSSDIDFKDFIKIYRKYTAEQYSFLVNDITLPSDDPLKFRKNLLK